jgi:hypothetical protein
VAIRITTSTGGVQYTTAANNIVAGQTTWSLAITIKVNSGFSAIGTIVGFGSANELFMSGFPSNMIDTEVFGSIANYTYNFAPTVGTVYCLTLSASSSLTVWRNVGATLNSTNTNLGSAYPALAQQLMLGWDGSNASDFTIERLAVWSGYALTARDSTNYASGVSPLSIGSGLAAYWSLSGTVGNHPAISDAGLNDASGNGHSFTALSGISTLATYAGPLVIPSAQPAAMLLSA